MSCSRMATTKLKPVLALIESAKHNNYYSVLIANFSVFFVFRVHCVCAQFFLFLSFAFSTRWKALAFFRLHSELLYVVRFDAHFARAIE